MTCWLIKANSQKYNHEGAFNRNGFIDWGQYGNYKVGDIVYIYCTKPEGIIRYKTEVIRINQSKEEIPDDREFWISDFSDCDKYVRLEFKKESNNPLLSYAYLTKHGLKSVRPRKQEIINEKLLSYIDEGFKSDNVLDGFQSWLTSDNNPKNANRKKKYSYVGYTSALVKLIKFMFENSIIPSDELNELNVSRYQSYLSAFYASPEAQQFDDTENSTYSGRSALKLYINYIKYLCPFYDYNDSRKRLILTLITFLSSPVKT